jgi:hypothetical protein
MAAKKAKRAKGKSSKKTKSRSKSLCEFPCPNPGKQLGLEAIIRRMKRDPEFADFIRDLLCASHKGTEAEAKAAQKCLDSYYKPTGDELTTLCIPKEYLAMKCTVHPTNLLIAVPAEFFRHD